MRDTKQTFPDLVEDALNRGLYVEVVANKNSIHHRYYSIKRTHEFGRRLEIRLIGEPNLAPPHNIELAHLAPGSLGSRYLSLAERNGLKDSLLLPTCEVSEFLAAAVAGRDRQVKGNASGHGGIAISAWCEDAARSADQRPADAEQYERILESMGAKVDSVRAEILAPDDGSDADVDADGAGASESKGGEPDADAVESPTGTHVWLPPASGAGADEPAPGADAQGAESAIERSRAVMALRSVELVNQMVSKEIDAAKTDVLGRI